MHFHGYDAHQTDVIEANIEGYRSAFDYAASIVVVSNKMKDSLINLGAPVQKISVNPCSPNPEFFQISRGQVTDNQDILFVGRFVEKKAPMLLLKAFDLVRTKHKKAKLLMVGEGPIRVTI